ncbi:MAG: tripartite tricarboxylate transporter TctB family protein [Chloroflexota bacterium]
MRRVYQATAVVFILFSLFVLLEARTMNYMTRIGPGAGFFPMWLALLLGGLSLAWLVQVSVRPVEAMAPDFVPDKAGILRILQIVGALILFTMLVGQIGFQLTTFVFLLFLLYALGHQRPLVVLTISILGSFGVYYVFYNWLGVVLPPASIDWLQNLGL